MIFAVFKISRDIVSIAIYGLIAKPFNPVGTSLANPKVGDLNLTPHPPETSI